MERLSGLDASFLYNETPTLHMHTLKISILDPSPWGSDTSHELIRDEIARRLHLLPPFRRRLVEVPLRFHHPVWIEDPNFDIDYHVRRATVAAPGGSEEMDDVIGRIASHPLDRTRPLWQLYVLDGLADGRIGVLIKIHHAAADGVAASQLLANAMSTLADEDLPPSGAPDWTPEPVPSPWRLLADAMWDHIRQLGRLPGLLISTLGRLGPAMRARRAATVDLPRPILDTPRTSFNVSLTPQRVFATTTLSLSEVKVIRRAHGVTVNDVLLALVAGALRSYLLERDELPDQPLVAGIPVSTDQPDAVARLAGNKVSNLFTSLATDVEDPVERLHAIHDVMVSAKEVHNLLGATMMQDWIEYTPPAPYSWVMRQYSRHGIADHHRPPINLVMSNVPGPREPLYAAGAKLVGLYSVGPILEGVGLNITVWSYLDDLNVGVLACREAIPNAHVITSKLQAALAELSASVVDQPTVAGSG